MAATQKSKVKAIKSTSKKGKTDLTPEAKTTDSKIRIRVKEEDFMRRLTEKLTHFDASLILEAAMLSAGVDRNEGFFRKDEAKVICLELIKRGGPAFSVGAGIYREVMG